MTHRKRYIDNPIRIEIPRKLHHYITTPRLNLFPDNNSSVFDRFNKIAKIYPRFARPITFRIETINICNYSCIFCGKKTMKREKKIMDMDLFIKIIKEYAEIGGGHLSLAPQTGEIFNDPLFKRRIEILKKYPNITTLSITTNATPSLNLPDDDLIFILDSLNEIHISIYGLDENEHFLITGKNDYLRNIVSIKRLITLIGHNKIVFGVRILKNKTSNEIEDWIFEEFKLPIPFGFTSEYANMGGSVDDSIPLPLDAKWMKSTSSADSKCIISLFNMRIFSDGSLSFCGSGDSDISSDFYIGNLRDSNFLSLYNSGKMRQLYNSTPKRCLKCSYYKPISEYKEKLEYCFKNPVKVVGG